MLPAQLTPADFATYPAEARALATADLQVLQTLPLAFAPFLLREIAGLDWMLPAERRDLLQQLTVLRTATPEARAHLLSGFTSIDLGSGPASPAQADWARHPASFIELLTAWLWSSHQMPHFRQVADEFARACAQASPPPPPPPDRLGLVLIGQGTGPSPTPLFQRLRPFGVTLSAVDPAGGTATLLHELADRAAATPAPFRHWAITGGEPLGTSSSVAHVSYAALAPARDRLLQHTEQALASGTSGPEQLRSELARLEPAQIGLPASALGHLQLSLLTEGSGTQIFATTFVQWAAREVIRRAEPATLLLRFAPRRRAQSMDAMLGGTPSDGLDLPGSLVDADEAAWLTFVNLRRLPGADRLRFLVWHEGQRQAFIAGPGLPAGTASSTPLPLDGVLKLLT